MYKRLEIFNRHHVNERWAAVALNREGAHTSIKVIRLYTENERASRLLAKRASLPTSKKRSIPIIAATAEHHTRTGLNLNTEFQMNEWF